MGVVGVLEINGSICRRLRKGKSPLESETVRQIGI